MDVDVRTGEPPRQRLAVGGRQGQCDHVLVVRDHPTVHHAQRMCVVSFRDGGRPPNARGKTPDAGHDDLGNAQKRVVA